LAGKPSRDDFNAHWQVRYSSDVADDRRSGKAMPEDRLRRGVDLGQHDSVVPGLGKGEFEASDSCEQTRDRHGVEAC
jgi:hypothetical protein